MARIFIDGFESGDHDMWDAENNATVVSGSMDGSYMLDLIANLEYLQKDVTATDEMYFAFLYYPASIYAGPMFNVSSGATVLVSLRRLASTHLVGAYVGAGLVETASSGSLAMSVSHLIEAHIKIADSGGRIEVKVNGIQVIDYTGDTKPGADTQFDNFRLGYCGQAGDTDATFDNMIVDDAAWIGNTKIQAVVPTGAGNSTGWTPSAGANYECVDERPASDADYVSINTNDTTDTYTTGNLAGTIGAVKCVQVQSRMRTDGAPTPTNLKLVVRSGATDYLSGDKAVTAIETSLWNLWETDPADASAWTEADVNAMEIGVKSAA